MVQLSPPATSMASLSSVYISTSCSSFSTRSSLLAAMSLQTQNLWMSTLSTFLKHCSEFVLAAFFLVWLLAFLSHREHTSQCHFGHPPAECGSKPNQYIDTIVIHTCQSAPIITIGSPSINRWQLFDRTGNEVFRNNFSFRTFDFRAHFASAGAMSLSVHVVSTPVLSSRPQRSLLQLDLCPLPSLSLPF